MGVNCVQLTEQNEIKALISFDYIFRRSFHNISTSPEAFHVLRCKCVVTHAVISICHYIIGIGDRHLSNFMVNMRTGEMVGIDFGHAFGSATTVCILYYTLTQLISPNSAKQTALCLITRMENIAIDAK